MILLFIKIFMVILIISAYGFVMSKINSAFTKWTYRDKERLSDNEQAFNDFLFLLYFLSSIAILMTIVILIVSL